MLRRSRTVANGSLPALRADPADPGMNSKSLKNMMDYNVFSDFGLAFDKYAPIVTGIGQKYADSDMHLVNTRRYEDNGKIYADSDRHWTSIRR